ncbi:hypothetical protein DFS34DRAFT_594426 [Phlyctochytrium arcticum]|nr:hypothetical protein DFS34DRAFT_594426 [Phlyctochytrium arcticum]
MKQSSVNGNTSTSTSTWLNNWKLSKSDIGVTTTDELISKDQLDGYLQQFWHQVKQECGKDFKDTTAKTGFAAISQDRERPLANVAERGEDINLFSDIEFRGFNKILNARFKNLQEKGYTGVSSADNFTMKENEMISSSIFCNPNTAEGLLHRVKVYVAMYLIERGGQPLSMLLSDLEEKVDQNTGQTYYRREKFAFGRTPLDGSVARHLEEESF